MARLRPFLAVLASALFAAQGANAADTSKAVADGVTLITRTTANPFVIHVLKVDLATPGIHLGGTATAQRKQRTSSFVKAVSATAGINGDFFSYATYGTSSLAVGGGAAWADTTDNKGSANLVFDNAQRIEFHDAAEVVTFDPTWMKGVVGGHPQVVNAGVALAQNPTASACATRNPRTAVGVSQDGKTLFLAAIDGRSTASIGMTCTEVAALMKGLGAYDAVNFDGGGSTTMYVTGTGVVNKPSDGVERVVGNHLALFAPKLGSVGTVLGTIVRRAPSPRQPKVQKRKAAAARAPRLRLSPLCFWRWSPSSFEGDAPPSAYLTSSTARRTFRRAPSRPRDRTCYIRGMRKLLGIGAIGIRVTLEKQ